MKFNSRLIRISFLMLLGIPLTSPLLADHYCCPIVSGGAESVTNPGSAMNLGQVAIGLGSNASGSLHAGGLACLRVFSTCKLGDVNGDGNIDGLDVDPYTGVKITGIGTPRELCASNIDVAGFVALLLGA